MSWLKLTGLILLPLPIYHLYTKYFINRVFNLEKYKKMFFLNGILIFNFINRIVKGRNEFIENIIESSVGYSIFILFFLLGISALFNKSAYRYNTKSLYLSFIYLFLSFTLIMSVLNSAVQNNLIFFTLIGLYFLYHILYLIFIPMDNLPIEIQDIEDKSLIREIADFLFFTIDNVIYRKKLLYFLFHFPLFFTACCLYFQKIEQLSDILFFLPHYIMLIAISVIGSFFMRTFFFQIYSLIFIGAILLGLNEYFIRAGEYLLRERINQSIYYLIIEPFICGLFDIFLVISLTLSKISEMAIYYLFHSVVLNLIFRLGFYGPNFDSSQLYFPNELIQLAVPFINIAVLLIPLSLEASRQTICFELGFSLLFTYLLYIIILSGQLTYYEK